MMFAHIHSTKEKLYGLFNLHVQLDFTIGGFENLRELLAIFFSNNLHYSHYGCGSLTWNLDSQLEIRNVLNEGESDRLFPGTLADNCINFPVTA